MKTNTLQIKTPEGVVFSQMLAGPVVRFLAWSVDAAAIGAALMIISIPLGILKLISFDLAGAILALGYFAITIGYGIVLEWFWRGQTIGKKLLRLRVVDAEALRLQFSQVVIRNLLRFVDSLPLFYFVGGVACWLSRKYQRLGDLAANTIVVRNPQAAEPDLDHLLAGKYNSMRQFPHLAARLRQRITPAEAALALQALLRRDDFESLARVDLFAELVAHFRGKLEFPAEATEGLSDEQYVRNVVDVLHRARRSEVMG
jgi:uncharacterized RDD family membrane protein YckC